MMQVASTYTFVNKEVFTQEMLDHLDALFTETRAFLIIDPGERFEASGMTGCNINFYVKLLLPLEGIEQLVMRNLSIETPLMFLEPNNEGYEDKPELRYENVMRNAAEEAIMALNTSIIQLIDLGSLVLEDGGEGRTHCEALDYLRYKEITIFKQKHILMSPENVSKYHERQPELKEGFQTAAANAIVIEEPALSANGGWIQPIYIALAVNLPQEDINGENAVTTLYKKLSVAEWFTDGEANSAIQKAKDICMNGILGEFLQNYSETIERTGVAGAVLFINTKEMFEYLGKGEFKPKKVFFDDNTGPVTADEFPPIDQLNWQEECFAAYAKYVSEHSVVENGILVKSPTPETILEHLKEIGFTEYQAQIALQNNQHTQLAGVETVMVPFYNPKSSQDNSLTDETPVKNINVYQGGILIGRFEDQPQERTQNECNEVFLRYLNNKTYGDTQFDVPDTKQIREYLKSMGFSDEQIDITYSTSQIHTIDWFKPDTNLEITVKEFGDLLLQINSRFGPQNVELFYEFEKMLLDADKSPLEEVFFAVIYIVNEPTTAPINTDKLNKLVKFFMGDRFNDTDYLCLFQTYFEDQDYHEAVQSRLKKRLSLTLQAEQYVLENYNEFDIYMKERLMDKGYTIIEALVTTAMLQSESNTYFSTDNIQLFAEKWKQLFSHSGALLPIIQPQAPVPDGLLIPERARTGLLPYLGFGSIIKMPAKSEAEVYEAFKESQKVGVIPVIEGAGAPDVQYIGKSLITGFSNYTIGVDPVAPDGSNYSYSNIAVFKNGIVVGINESLPENTDYYSRLAKQFEGKPVTRDGVEIGKTIDAKYNPNNKSIEARIQLNEIGEGIKSLNKTGYEKQPDDKKDLEKERADKPDKIERLKSFLGFGKKDSDGDVTKEGALTDKEKQRLTMGDWDRTEGPDDAANGDKKTVAGDEPEAGV